ncbi:membrane protein insertase YidC [Gallaecimonas sp. GXIMD4217]|uniref:membrane protein insertase YidC n=1 Tax=Gallaecimonas sp. GXIMD4217 TaxID=3131927 RepID=UPI00311AD074
MESQRTLLFFGFLAVSYLLFSAWQEDQAPKPVSQPQAIEQSLAPSSTNGDLPASDLPATQASASVVEFGNDMLELKVDTKGGDVVNAQLKQFARELNGEERFTLLTKEPGFNYVAMSGLIGPDGSDSQGRPVYEASEVTTLADGSRQLTLTHVNDKGVQFKKILTLAKGSYVVNTRFEVVNATAQPLTVQYFGQLKQTVTPSEGGFVATSYRGAAYSSDDNKYEKYDFEDMQDKNLREPTGKGWIAMLQHYFVSAWAPKFDNLEIYSLVAGSRDAIIGVKSELLTVPANDKLSLDADLFVGPKDQDALEAVAPRLELTVDYGFLWFIGKPLFWLLQALHGLVANWGFAIILLTVIVKMALFPLTKAQYTSMAKMRVLAPKLTALREKYGDDRQRLSQAMMELYKKEEVNPLGGCLPLLLQMPIFIALYWVLLESVELRHADFAFWIHDLSVKDPFFVLPILMGVTMYVMQKLQPSTITDPMQQKVMQFMPVMFTFFFLFMPAGLVIYWVVSNLISIAQQLVIMKGLEKKGLK